MNRVINFLFFLFLGSFFIAAISSLSLHGALTTKTAMPEFLSVTDWLNTETPLSRKDLTGKVVLVEFWSLSSRNSLRRAEVLNQWHERYKSEGFVIIGVLTPEFEFEKDPLPVKEEIKKYKIEYPIALDNQGGLRRAYNPITVSAAFLMDGEGRIHEVISDEMNYEAVEKMIQQLLQRANPRSDIPEEIVRVPAYGRFPDFYFGYRKLYGYGNEIKLSAGNAQAFSLPGRIDSGQFYVSGTWTSKEENLEVIGTPASLTLRLPAQKFYAVAGSQAGGPTPAEVRLNGKPLDKSNKGKDVILQEGRSYWFVESYRLYEIVKLPAQFGEQQLEILFEEPGVELFKMSFE
jgi:hypothetical protein